MADSPVATPAPAPAPVKEVWAPAATVDVSQFDDQQLLSYRHEAERRALAATPLILILISIALWFLGPSLRESPNWAPRPVASAILRLSDPGSFLGLAVVACWRSPSSISSISGSGKGSCSPRRCRSPRRRSLNSPRSSTG
jgi:hypothetical protein